MLFKLKQKVGLHRQNGRIFGPGDVVESNEDLTKKFRGKFNEVKGEELSPGVDDKFKRRKPPIPVPPVPMVPVEEAKSKAKEKTAVEKINVDPELGKDITADFPEAKEIGLKVFVNPHKWCQVVDANNDNKILNEKKLRKKDVDDFLHQYLNEEDEEEEIEEDEEEEEEGMED